MSRFFISHSTKDEVGPAFVEYLKSIGVVESDIFCSSYSYTGINATSMWFPELFKEINKAETVILLVTPNYMRSSVSLLEAGAALGANKNLLILAFPNVELSELNGMFGGHQIIDFNAKNVNEQFERLAKEYIIPADVNCENVINVEFRRFTDIMFLHRRADVDNPPIGLSRENERLIKPCVSNGIERISLEPIDMKQKLGCASKIRIIATTGAGFFRTYNVTDMAQNSLYKALLNGCEIEILLGNPSGGLFNDVETIEKRETGALDKEFENVISELSKLIKEVKKNGGRGAIRVGNVDNSLRQTAILLYDEDVCSWGWATVTLPPLRCNIGIPSFELQKVENGLLKSYENYFNAIWEKAATCGEICDLSGNDKIECFRYEGEFARKKWMELQEQAHQNMAHAEEENGERLLIECAAQHPLRPNGEPGREFKKRLDYAISHYNVYKEKHWDVKIYVPGSLHMKENYKGEYSIDKCSLSVAGKMYLTSKGIPESDVLADETNKYYRGEAGVYCSADECYVSSQVFQDGNYGRFFVICSPAQAMRKALYYIKFGTLPIIYTTSPESHRESVFHNYAYEATESIPSIIATLGEMSEESAKRIRANRDPRYSKY